ncbi:MAG: hypothetical protein ACR2H3_05195 [Acidimicrobiales bacterium]
MAVVIATAMTTVMGLALPAGAAVPKARKVLIVSLPRLTWVDLAQDTPPALDGLLRKSAVASLSPRTIGAVTSLGEGYASIGAGNRATLISASAMRLRPWMREGDAGLAFGVDERFAGADAADIFERRMGTDAGDAEVVHIGMAALERANERLLYETVPGSLGEALRAGGRRAAVIGNADLTEAEDESVLQRHLALALVDRVGRVEGRVDQRLLRSDPAAPFGVVLDADAVVASFEAAWRSADVVLVEASDLERADAFRAVATPKTAQQFRLDALNRFDAILARLLDRIDLSKDLVIVTSPAPPRGTSQLLVSAMAGPNVEPGQLRSATTRRDGYVTLPDVWPTVLAALGLDVPVAMTGALMSSGGGDTFSSGTVESLAEANERATYRDRVTGLVTAIFIIFQLLVYALAAIAFSRHRRSLLHLAGPLSLMVLAFPPLAFLSGLFPYYRLAPIVYLVALFAAAAALAVAATVVGSGDPQRPPVLLLGLSLLVLVGDVVSGGALQLNTVFGYSPIVAGRFAGFGNLASALVSVTAILVVAGAWGMAARRGDRPGFGSRWLLAGIAVLVIALVVAGLPSFGSDVGGVLTDVPAFTVTILLLAGVQIGWRRAAAIGGGTAVVLALFAALDLARPPEVRTHLGRLVSRTLASEGGGLLTTIERKAAANVSILTSSIWTYAIPITLAFLAFLVWRPQGFLRGVIERFPGTRAGLIGALVAGLLGFALNDSGVAIPAMMLGVLLPYLAWLVARTAIPEVGASPVARTPAGTPDGAERRL